MAGILVAGVLTPLPVSEAFATESGDDQQKAQNEQQGQISTITKVEAEEIRASSKKVQNYQSVISTETKSPNYAVTLQSYQIYTSPTFTYTSGDVLVTLVQ